MVDDDERICRCGHPEGEHTIYGECVIHRRRGEGQLGECGCPMFMPQTQEGE